MSIESRDIQDRIEGILAAEDGDEEYVSNDGSTDVEEPDEDAEVLAEAEADDEAEAEAATDDEVDDEADEDESGGPAEIVVEIDGQPTRLTADEVKAGYLRASDYTRKTQEVARDRDAIAAERKAFETAQQRAYQQFEQQLQTLQALQEPEPDWKAIRAEDPLGYIAMKAEWDEKQAARHNLIQQHRHRAAQQQEQALHARAQQLQAQRQQLPELIPEWRDETVMRRETADLAAALKADGFDPQDVDSITDARLVRWLLDAKRYRDTQKSTAKPEIVKKKTAGKPKVAKPGTTPKGNPEKTAARNVLDAARKSQRPQDWARAFERFV
jgi:hypothetical protein